MADDADIARWDAALERSTATRHAAFIASHLVVAAVADDAGAGGVHDPAGP
jgi:hypothetical protein